MTLIELLRFASTQVDKCLFILYHDFRGGNTGGLTTTEIRTKLASCRIPHRQINVSDAVGRANHYVDRKVGQKLQHKWLLTFSGLQYVESKLKDVLGNVPAFGGESKKVVHKKINILFLGLAPTDTPNIRLDKETREIESKIRASEYRDAFNFHSKWAVRTSDLFQHIHQIKPDVLHISGHGSPSGEIAFEDDNGRSRMVTPLQLSTALSSIESDIKIALFNLCYSNEAAKKLVDHFTCSVGLTGPIADESAVTFAASFYLSLGFGKSVVAAFREARAALVLEGLPGDHLLELNVRAGLEADKIKLLE